MRLPTHTFLVSFLFVATSHAATSLLTNLPANVLRVPVALAQCLALHPTRPVLFVGRSDRQSEGKGLAVLRLDDEGGIIADGRIDVADGVVDVTPPVPEDLLYSIASIAVNPTLSQIHLASSPKRPRSFKMSTNVVHLSSLWVNDDGIPQESVDGYRNPFRNTGIYHLGCDPLGRFVYFGEVSGNLGFWPTGNEEMIRVSKPPPPTKPHQRSVVRRHTAKMDRRANLVTPYLRMAMWTYVPEWKRSYGGDSGMTRAIFTFGEDGRSCSFMQAITMPTRNAFPPQVSVKHQKMYVPYAQGSKLGIYLLTRQGRLTSVPKFVPIDPVRLACVDDVNDRLYVVQAKGVLSVYSLDADGIPSAEPQRFDLQAGDVKDMIVSPKGVLYLACATPPGGKP